MAALSFRERIGLRRLTNTEHQCSEYLTPRRSLSVRFATPAIPGRSEKLLSENGSRPARGLEPVRRRFGSASVVPFMAEIRTIAYWLQEQAENPRRRACPSVSPRASVRAARLPSGRPGPTLPRPSFPTAKSSHAQGPPELRRLARPAR